MQTHRSDLIPCSPHSTFDSLAHNGYQNRDVTFLPKTISGKDWVTNMIAVRL